MLKLFIISNIDVLFLNTQTKLLNYMYNKTNQIYIMYVCKD